MAFCVTEIPDSTYLTDRQSDKQALLFLTDEHMTAQCHLCVCVCVYVCVCVCAYNDLFRAPPIRAVLIR